MRVSIYNHQLCLLNPAIRKFAVRSISDWKNEYMPECQGCELRQECGGFFSSAKLKYSAHIKAQKIDDRTVAEQRAVTEIFG